MLRRARPQNLPSKPVAYPPGTFVETESGYFYIVSPVKRYRLLSRRVLDSWSPARVVKTTEAAVSKYKISSKLKFRNGSLIHNVADGKIYLIVQGKRCHITSPDVLEMLGATSKDVMHVSEDEIRLHEAGEALNGSNTV